MTKLVASISFCMTVFVLSPFGTGAEIMGKVSKVDGKTISINVSSDQLPVAGDKLDVFVEVPNVGKAVIGVGTIVSVESDTIVAKIDRATGRLAVGQLVAITSPNPQERPSSGATARETEEQVVVTAASGQIKSGSTILARVPRGTRLVILQTKGDWYQVKAPGTEQKGWIYNQQAQRLFDGWGAAIDPDGDSTIRANAGKLTITVSGGLHDLWPSRPAKQRFNAPRVLQEVDGDFVMQVKLTADWKPYNDDTNIGAGLFVWHSGGDFIRCERHVFIRDGGPKSYTGPMCIAKNKWISARTKTDPDTLYQGPTTWFRVERNGDMMTCSKSHNGVDWEVTEKLNTGYPRRLQVGVHAVKISPGEFTAEFENFQLERK